MKMNQTFFLMAELNSPVTLQALASFLAHTLLNALPAHNMEHDTLTPQLSALNAQDVQWSITL